MVWQFAIGTGVHIGNKQGGCFFKIALVEIVKGSLLASLDIFGTCSPTGVSRAFKTAPDAVRILGRPS